MTKEQLERMALKQAGQVLCVHYDTDPMDSISMVELFRLARVGLWAESHVYSIWRSLDSCPLKKTQEEADRANRAGHTLNEGRLTATEILRRGNGPFTEEEAAMRKEAAEALDRKVIRPYLAPLIERVCETILKHASPKDSNPS